MPTGNVSVVDVDAKHADPNLAERFEEVVRDLGLDPTIMPKQRTPNGNGAHYFFRSESEIRNRKLATGTSGKTIIETRGKGGYVCIAPSPGYVMERGSLTDVPLLDAGQIAILMDAAKSFDQRPAKSFSEPVRSPWQKSNQGLSPGDDYNQRGEGDLFLLLRAHGWHAISKNRWRRPGKDRGFSATWDVVPGKFFVFSSNAAQFDPDTSYSPFAVYALLEHGGDFAAAAAALRADGYGGDEPVDPAAAALANAVLANWEAKQNETGIPVSETKKEPKYIIREHSDRLRDCRNPPPWLIRNTIGVGHLACWVALPGVGKTLLAIETASAVASGDNFANCPVDKPGRVLYLCTDAPVSTERRMLALPESAQGNVSSVADFPPLPGGIVELAEILEAAKDRPYRLVVLDTWDSTRDHSDGSWASQDGSVEMVMRGLRKLARQYEIAILIIHHTIREGQRTRGSGVFDARMDVIGLVDQKDGGLLSLSLIKARDSEARVVGKWQIEAVDLWEDGNEVPRLAYVDSVAESMPANHLAVLKAIQSGADSHGSIVQKTKIVKGTVSKVVKKLREDGLVEMESYSLTPAGREVEEIRLQMMVEQVLRNGGYTS